MLNSASIICKYSFILSLLTLFSCNIIFPKANKSITIKTKIYCPQCTYCAGCKARIENFIKYINGVSFTKFDTLAQTITLQYNSVRTNPQKLRKAIAKFGYDADDVPANTAAYKLFYPCCKRKE